MRVTLKTLGAAALGVGMMGVAYGATTVPIEFGGYFRSGAGTSDKGGKEICFRLPGAQMGVGFRLGNECDTYAEFKVFPTFGEVDGTTFKGAFIWAYGTQQLANWEQSDPSFRSVLVEAENIGAGLKIPALNGATLWGGKRLVYYNPDIHMLDYGFWEPAQGTGAGLDKVNVGIGKFSYAFFRVGEGDNTLAGTGDPDDPRFGFNPDIVRGGDRTYSIHDFRLQEVPVNPGGQIFAGFDFISPSKREGSDPAFPEGKKGYGLTVYHKQADPFGLPGVHSLIFQYAKDAATLRGAGFLGETRSRNDWMLFNHWIFDPKTTPLPISGTLSVGIRRGKIDDPIAGETKVKEAWAGVRPQYHITNIWSLMSELGYQQLKVDGEDGTRKLAKITVGTQVSMGRSVWSRPAIRFYATYAKWNTAAAQGGTVVCTGRDCGRAVPEYNFNPVTGAAGERKGVAYGIQVEGWF